MDESPQPQIATSDLLAQPTVAPASTPLSLALLRKPHFQRKYLAHGLVHMATFAAAFFPGGSIIIPYLVYRLRRMDPADELAQDARRAYNYQRTMVTFAPVILALGCVAALISYPFLGALGGVNQELTEREFTALDAVYMVIFPSYALYLGVWSLMALRAASARFMGYPYTYPLTREYLKD